MICNLVFRKDSGVASGRDRYRGGGWVGSTRTAESNHRKPLRSDHHPWNLPRKIEPWEWNDQTMGVNGGFWDSTVGRLKIAEDICLDKWQRALLNWSGSTRPHGNVFENAVWSRKLFSHLWKELVRLSFLKVVTLQIPFRHDCFMLYDL